MKTIRLFVFFATSLVTSTCGFSQQAFNNFFPTSNRIELFSSFSELSSGGTVISDFRYLRINAAQDSITVTTNKDLKTAFAIKSLWGYKVYYPNSDSVGFYRLDARFISNRDIGALVASQQEDLVIYSFSSDKRNRHRSYVAKHKYFSKDLGSRIYQLDLRTLQEFYSSRNPHFVKLIGREINQTWGIGCNAVNKKTGRLIVVELYEQSLADKLKTPPADTSLYHLKISKSDGNYWLFNLQVNQYTANNSPGLFSSSFPYHSLDTVSGLQRDKTADITSAPFRQQPVFIDFMLEHDRFRNCFGLQMGLAQNYSRSFHFALYYGYAIDLNLSASKKHTLTLKPGINVSYHSYSEQEGSIDNENKYISALSTSFAPMFRITTHHSTGKYSSGYNTYAYYRADKINLYYRISSWSLCPMLTLANNRKQRIYCALNAGWNFVFYDNSGLTLSQTGVAVKTSVIGQGKEIKVPFTNPGIASDKQGSAIFKAPFKSGGPFIGVSLGFYLNK